MLTAQEGALTSVWAVVMTSAGALVWTGWELGVVGVLNIVAFVALVGVWATLQFRFIYRDEQDVARLLERYLFYCSVPTAARRFSFIFCLPLRKVHLYCGVSTARRFVSRFWFY